MAKIIHVFDIDGTLITTPEIDWLDDNFNWPEWLSASWSQGELIPKTVESLRRSLDSQITDVWLVTARPEAYRRDTELQLASLGIFHNKFRLVMRPDDECEAETRAYLAMIKQTAGKDYAAETIKGYIHQGHMKYRKNVRKAFEVIYGADGLKELTCWDDQEENFKAWPKTANKVLVTEKDHVKR